MRADSTVIGAGPISARKVFETGLVLLAVLSPMLWTPVVDPDLWGHLRFGLDMLRAHAVARTDPYSYTAFGRPWFDQEWLSELLFGAVYSVAGAAGLGLLRLLTNMALLASGCRYVHARGVPWVQAAAVMLLYSIPCDIGMMQVRPEIFTCLLFLAALVTLVQAENGHLRVLWLLPPIFALWANLHGGFLAGAALVMAWAVLRALKRWPHVGAMLGTLRAAAPPIGVALLATCANPYGLALPLFLAWAAALPRS